MPPVDVVRTYLEMTGPDQLIPAPRPDARARIEQVEDCSPSFYRHLYQAVGERYHWVDRLAWTDDEIRTHLAARGVGVWVLYAGNAPAGYFELKRHEDGSSEIAYFGLLPEFTGQGLGKYLLTEAVREAWRSGPPRVWLHTCSLDHPAALPNYVARGFRPYKEETYPFDPG
jgi:GNAT superfamily N-acetyltransferase